MSETTVYIHGREGWVGENGCFILPISIINFNTHLFAKFEEHMKNDDLETCAIY